MNNYTNDELGFILYNNRSKNLVKRFVKNINPFHLIKIEKIYELSGSELSNTQKVEVDKKDLELNSQDVLIHPSDIEALTEKFINSVGIFNESEREFLYNRGITDDLIDKWHIMGLSNFTGDDLITIGATVHPILRNVLSDGIEDGGIILPLFDGCLVNCAIRKISLSKKAALKYTMACPDIPVWRSNDINIGDEIWITEGIFDLIALDSIGLKTMSCSSANWSSIQLYEILKMKPSKINIMSDNDETGLRISAILKNFFDNYKIYCSIYRSEHYKDASEHILENKCKDDFLQIEVTEDMISLKKDESFNFLKYLIDRKF